MGYDMFEAMPAEEFVKLVEDRGDKSQLWIEACMCAAIRERIRERSLARKVLALEGEPKKTLLREGNTDTLSYQKADGTYGGLLEQNFRGETIGSFFGSKGWRVPYVHTATQIVAAPRHMVLAEDNPVRKIVNNMANDLLAAEDARMVEMVKVCVATSALFVDGPGRLPTHVGFSTAMQNLQKITPGNASVACSQKTFDDLLQLPAKEGLQEGPRTTEDERSLSFKDGDAYLGTLLIVLQKDRMPDDTFFIFRGGKDGAGPMSVLEEARFYIRSVLGTLKWGASMVTAFTLDSRRVAVYRYGDAVQ